MVDYILRAGWQNLFQNFGNLYSPFGKIIQNLILKRQQVSVKWIKTIACWLTEIYRSNKLVSFVVHKKNNIQRRTHICYIGLQIFSTCFFRNTQRNFRRYWRIFGKYNITIFLKLVIFFAFVGAYFPRSTGLMAASHP